MNPNQVSNEKIQERVQELVASVEQYARLSRIAIQRGHVLDAEDASDITVRLITELATLLGQGRLEVSRES